MVFIGMKRAVFEFLLPHYYKDENAWADELDDIYSNDGKLKKLSQ